MRDQAVICFYIQLALFLSSWFDGIHASGFGIFSAQAESIFSKEYSFDVTYPIQSKIDPRKYKYYSDRYTSIMEGCYKKYSRDVCDQNENKRLSFNREQPRNQHNYTSVGFKKIKAPLAAWNKLVEFYKNNADSAKTEEWAEGNTFTNHWEAPTKMVSFDDRTIKGTSALRDSIWNSVRPILEEWTGHALVPTSLYGIRVYQEGSVLAPHVDRLPLVNSAIIQVAQDVDEPWPLEVYDHSGMAYNITLEPGEMVLYESATVVHGRPFPLKGRSYANVFVHFQPIDHEEMNQIDKKEQDSKSNGHTLLSSIISTVSNGLNGSADDTTNVPESNNNNNRKEHVDEFRRKFMDLPTTSTSIQVESTSPNKHLVDYKEDHNNRLAVPGYPTELPTPAGYPAPTKPPARSNLRKRLSPVDEDFLQKWNELRKAAATANIRVLQSILESEDGKYASLLHRMDDNHWQILHESVRVGSLKCVRYLVSQGANPYTILKNGGTALTIAKSALQQGHPVLTYLLSLKVPDIKVSF